MELRQARYFVAVARAGHFRRAAETLRIAQPALSYQIQRLERELGVTLFERTSRRVRLTSAGSAFLERAERILAEVDRAEREMRQYAGLERGQIVVGALQSPETLRLPALLGEFRARYPGIGIVLREENTQQLGHALDAGQIDLALIALPSQPHVVDALSAAPPLPTTITTEQILEEEIVLAVAPERTLSAGAEIAFAELRDEQFIAYMPGSGLRATLFQACATAGFDPHIAFESRELSTMRALASAGLGVTLLPRSAAETPGAAIQIVSISNPPITRIVALAWNRSRAQAPATVAFLDLARAWWRDES